MLRDRAGVSALSEQEAPVESFGFGADADRERAVIMEDIGVAVIGGPDKGRAAAIAAALSAGGGVVEVRPEFYLFAIQPAGPPYADETDATWGLLATDVVRSPYTGSGIRIAVLDTGFDLHHPDFAGRTIVTQSFVPGETVQDLQGHGSQKSATRGSRQSGPF
jgi:subtilisin